MHALLLKTTVVSSFLAMLLCTEVYFEPAGYSRDSSIGTPLNKAAAESLNKDGLIPNVPYSIKESTDLSEAIEVGLKLCE